MKNLRMLIFATLSYMALGQGREPFYKQIDHFVHAFGVPVIKVADITKDKTKKYVFLDARELNEYQISHIKDAIHVGYKNFSLKRVDSVAKSQALVVYCSVGYRSGVIAKKLKREGYEVYNLYGGIFEWVQNGHKVYKSSDKPTNQVHGYDEKWKKWVENAQAVID